MNSEDSDSCKYDSSHGTTSPRARAVSKTSLKFTNNISCASFPDHRVGCVNLNVNNNNANNVFAAKVSGQVQPPTYFKPNKNIVWYQVLPLTSEVRKRLDSRDVFLNLNKTKVYQIIRYENQGFVHIEDLSTKEQGLAVLSIILCNIHQPGITTKLELFTNDKSWDNIRFSC